MAFVPMNDLGRALSAQKVRLTAAFTEVVDSGRLVLGPQHGAFERELAEYVGVPHALGVANGTDALELAIRAAAPADRHVVVTAANCGGYAGTAARLAGYEVRYADIDPATLLLDPLHLASVLDESVAVVVVTHLYGRAADVAAVRRLTEPLGVAVVEDCAQAIGARTPQGAVGSLGDAAAFSFYPTKNLGALGDGGAVTTASDRLADRVRSLRQYGWSTKYHVTSDGGRNSRLDEAQAAFLRVRLPGVDEGNAVRRGIIGAYASAAGERVRVLEAVGDGHVGHLAVVLTDDRQGLVAHLTEHEIGSDVHYPVPDHHQPAFRDRYTDVSLPVTEEMAGQVVSVPVFPELRDDEIRRVGDALRTF